VDRCLVFLGLSKAIKIDASNRGYGNEITEHEDGSHLHVEAFGSSSACAIGSIRLGTIFAFHAFYSIHCSDPDI
jgi:hypothetical protein